MTKQLPSNHKYGHLAYTKYATWPMYRTPIPSILMVLSDTMRPTEVATMVKVSIEVRNGSAHFNVAIRAQSIEQAANVVRGSYPDCDDVRVKFPIDSESFLVHEPAPRAGIVGVESPDVIAA